MKLLTRKIASRTRIGDRSMPPVREGGSRRRNGRNIGSVTPQRKRTIGLRGSGFTHDQRGDDDDPLQTLQRVQQDVDDGAGRRTAHVHAASRGPKRAVPIRTSVEPSSTATAKSWLIPIESSGSGRPNCAASWPRSSMSRRKYGRDFSGSGS